MAAKGQRQDDGNPEKQVAGAEIAEAVSRAQTAINRYDHTRKKLAANGRDPDGHPQLHEDLITLDAAVHDAYAKLRKYVKNDVKDKWWNKRVLGYEEDKTPIVFGGRDGGKIQIEDEEYEISAETNVDKVRFIEDYQGEVVEKTGQEYKRFEGWTKTRSIKPALMPVPAYRRAIQYLDEIRNELGFSPEAKKEELQSWAFEQVEEVPDDIEVI